MGRTGLWDWESTIYGCWHPIGTLVLKYNLRLGSAGHAIKEGIGVYPGHPQVATHNCLQIYLCSVTLPFDYALKKEYKESHNKVGTCKPASIACVVCRLAPVRSCFYWSTIAFKVGKAMATCCTYQLPRTSQTAKQKLGLNASPCRRYSTNWTNFYTTRYGDIIFRSFLYSRIWQ